MRFLYDDLHTVEGEPVWRTLPEGSFCCGTICGPRRKSWNPGKRARVALDSRRYPDFCAFAGGAGRQGVVPGPRGPARGVRPAPATHGDAETGTCPAQGIPSIPFAGACFPQCPCDAGRSARFKVVSLGNRLGKRGSLEGGEGPADPGKRDDDQRRRQTQRPVAGRRPNPLGHGLGGQCPGTGGCAARTAGSRQVGWSDEDLVQQGQRKPPHDGRGRRAGDHHRPRPAPTPSACKARWFRGSTPWSAPIQTASCNWRTSA